MRNVGFLTVCYGVFPCAAIGALIADAVLADPENGFSLGGAALFLFFVFGFFVFGISSGVLLLDDPRFGYRWCFTFWSAIGVMGVIFGLLSIHMMGAGMPLLEPDPDYRHPVGMAGLFYSQLLFTLPAIVLLRSLIRHRNSARVRDAEETVASSSA